MLVDVLSPFKRLKGESGQSTVEFALILPILFAVLFGIMDFGWLFFNIGMLSNSARQGARYAIVNYENSGNDVSVLTPDVELQVKNGLPSYLTNTGAHMSVRVTDTTMGAGSITSPTLSVNVQVRVPLFTPVLSTVFGHQYYQYNKTVTMIMES